MGRPRSPKGRGRLTVERLALEYPEIVIPLDHGSPFQLLAAVIMSAQTTDARVNQVTPALFARFPDAAAMAGADPLEVEELIHSTGFFRAKAKSLIGMAQAVVERHDGEIPATMKELTALPGVGRKTANVILGHWFGVPGGRGRHACAARVAASGTHRARRPGAGGAGPDGHLAATRLVGHDDADDLSRAGGVSGAASAVRGVCAGGLLSVVARLTLGRVDVTVQLKVRGT